MPSRHVYWDDDLTAHNTARNRRRPSPNRLTPSALADIPSTSGFNTTSWNWGAAPPDRQLGSDGHMHDIPSVSDAMARERERMRRDRERQRDRLGVMNDVVRDEQEREWAWDSEVRREMRHFSREREMWDRMGWGWWEA